MKARYLTILSVLIIGGMAALCAVPFGAGCAVYDSDNPPDNIWDPLSLEEVLETPGAVVGRIWVSPNPIVFGSRGEYPGD